MWQSNFTNGNIETERLHCLPGATQQVIGTLTKSLNSEASLIFTVVQSLEFRQAVKLRGVMWYHLLLPPRSSRFSTVDRGTQV